MKGSERKTPNPSLRSTFGNFSPKANTLIRRLNRGVYRVCNRPQNTAPRDQRGPVVRTVETVQTFLTASEVDHLVADYEAGAGTQELAEKYGIHRATVFAHLRRREVPRRHPGLSGHEQAEAVRLSRDGMSMRAIGRQMGVDRKAIRVALVDAGILPNAQLQVSHPIRLAYEQAIQHPEVGGLETRTKLENNQVATLVESKTKQPADFTQIREHGSDDILPPVESLGLRGSKTI